jgi:hypothetical protein
MPRRASKLNAELIAAYQREWESDKNPLAVWRALVEALASDAPLPSFVLDYLSDVGWDLLEMAARTRTDKSAMTDAKIVSALGLKRSGRGSLAAREHNRVRNRWIAMEVKRHLNDKHKLDHTYDHVAKLCRVKRKTVRDAWAEYGGTL